MFQYVEVLEKALRSKGINDLGYDFNVKEGLDVKNTKDSEIFLESIQTFIDSWKIQYLINIIFLGNFPFFCELKNNVLPSW